VVSGSSKAQFGVNVADMDTGSGKDKLDVKTVGVLAANLESKGVNVLAACNAGYFHKSAGTNYPYGMQIVNGTVVWTPNSDDTVHSDNWVGITFDGKMISGNTKDYENTYKGQLEYGVACGSYIMQDGKIKFQRAMSGKSCHTAIALTADGGFVIVVVDGRPENGNGTSDGASAFDVVTILWDLELEYTDAYILDGGGSSEMVIENGKYFYTQNSPSDISGGKRGKSRPVSDIIAVIIK
jgi:exopolysaccharide biosynthesis protein